MMKTVLTTLGGILIGPVAGFLGLYLSGLAVPDGECGVVAGPLAFLLVPKLRLGNRSIAKLCFA